LTCFASSTHPEGSTPNFAAREKIVFRTTYIHALWACSQISLQLPNAPTLKQCAADQLSMLKIKRNTVYNFHILKIHYNTTQSENFHPFSIVLTKETKDEVHTIIKKGNKSAYILLH
jgi:hypothetical protein